MMSEPIRFLFDYVSPYSYLASTQIRAIAARHGRTVEAVPVLFAGMLDAIGNRGLAEIPAKLEYMRWDVVRIARPLGVRIEPPATHPFNPLTALRVTACVAEQAARWRLIDALYRGAWVAGQRVDQPEVVARIADEVGHDGRALVLQAASTEAKARVRQATEDAIRRGAFGVPTMFVEGEMYWGVDSLPYLDRLLSGEKTMDSEGIARWRAVVPSAVRRGAG
jgi:2-hydroxychromene-2-carboxylate isomerase